MGCEGLKWVEATLRCTCLHRATAFVRCRSSWATRTSPPPGSTHMYRTAEDGGWPVPWMGCEERRRLGDAPARSGPRPSCGAGAPGPQGRRHHQDLHTCAGLRGTGRGESFSRGDGIQIRPPPSFSALLEVGKLAIDPPFSGPAFPGFYEPTWFALFDKLRLPSFFIHQASQPFDSLKPPHKFANYPQKRTRPIRPCPNQKKQSCFIPRRPILVRRRFLA
jgi:hypothetical protein